MNIKPSWDTTVDMFEGSSLNATPQKQQSPLGEVGKVANVSMIEALENKTTLLFNSHPLKNAIVLVHGGCPPEIRKSEIENATAFEFDEDDALLGLAVFDLYDENLKPKGAVFLNPTVEHFKDIVFGHGGIYFNRSNPNKLPLLVTDDVSLAFKTSYPVYAPFQQSKINAHTLKTLMQTNQDVCFIAPVHQKDNIQRRFTDLNVKLAFTDEPTSLDMTQDELDSLINEAVQQAMVLPKGHLAEPFKWGDGKFHLLNDGLYYLEEDSKGNEYRRYISSPIKVVARTRDTVSNAWGRLLEWSDPDGVRHAQAVSMELFQSDGVDLRKSLAYQGVTISPDGKARNLLQSYLMSYPTSQHALCVDRVGWHDDVFVLPHREIGKHSNGDLMVYQTTGGLDNRYQSKGTLEQWRTDISMVVENHSKLVFAMSTAFTGQLLTPLDQQMGAGIHFKGGSSKGKTTALLLGCSVWGKSSNFYRSWKSTGNALEHTAHMHNDGFLALDEIGEIARPRELGDIVYTLAHGKGKARLTKQITAKPSFLWKIIFLSTGEKSLNEIMKEQGQKAKLGQEIRLLDIDVDQSDYGIFDGIDFADDGAKQSKYITEQSNQHYGVAGIAWLEYLTSDKAGIIERAKPLLDRYHNQLTQQHKQGHIVRVANTFALIATAGELATQAGITGWKTGTAFNAVQTVFNQWVNNFEYVGDYEDKEILSQVKAFFEAHGSSRFEDLTVIRQADGEILRPRIHNRVGYYDSDEKIYLVSSTMFKKEICNGLNEANAKKVLKANGWLKTDVDRYDRKTSFNLPDGTRPRMMHFKADAMHSIDGS